MNHFRDRLEVNGCRGVIDAAIAVKVSNMQKRIAVSRIDHERAEEDEDEQLRVSAKAFRDAFLYFSTIVSIFRF